MMQFYYREAFKVRSPEAYETLLLDIMRGDPTLFMRADQTEAAWAVIAPILEMWQWVRTTDFPNYQAGTWGPEAADLLIAQDGRSWTMPTFLQCREDLAICQVAREATGIVRVYPGYEALSRAAAKLFVRLANEAIRDRGRFSVVLSGGRTPQRAYELLAGPPFNFQVDWGRVYVFWGDERCVPPEDPRNNAAMVREKLLDHVPAPPEHVHPIVCADSANDAARNYESLLRSFFEGGPPSFDLIFLGLGFDGHTASLFPGTPAQWERNRWVTEIYSEKEAIHRVTLTVPILNQASVLAFIVSGASKAEVLREVMTRQPEPERFPARLITPECGGKLYWLVDTDSASLLKT